MQKILKLTGVSILAIMTASNANAAGYTCEELIEYTSCNPGYYFTQDASCRDGYELQTGYCYLNSDEGYLNETATSCQAKIEPHIGDTEYEDARFVNYACVNSNQLWGMGEYGNFYEITELGATHCIQCPAGASCTGGTAGATPCPAGSYCATAGLSQPTGKCAVGSFASAGATVCTSCPSTGLTDINGVVVNATTASTGSTSITACIVGSESQFEDDKGVYHYKSECAFDYATMTINDESECSEIGGEWQEEPDTACFLPRSFFPQTEEECVADGLDWSIDTCYPFGCDWGAGGSPAVSQGVPGIQCL